MGDPTPSGDAIRQVIANILTLFTRRPFTILIPILAGALIAPVLTGIGIGAQAAGVLALIVIAALMLILSSAWVRRMCVHVGRFIGQAVRRWIGARRERR